MKISIALNFFLFTANGSLFLLRINLNKLKIESVKVFLDILAKKQKRGYKLAIIKKKYAKASEVECNLKKKKSYSFLTLNK